MKLYKKFLITSFLILGVCISLLMMPLAVVNRASRLIHSDTQLTGQESVAIVFGAGLIDSKTPSSMLNDRLIVAANLYHQKKVQTILVSGDNRFANYSEPDVMFDTLVNKLHVAEADIHLDYAGRRTYDTCIRAHNMWGVDNAILITQTYHLPRAIWTCEHLGINSVGVSASLQPYLFESKYKKRETLATYKAFIDVYILKPDYIGGEFIQNLD